jgi:lipid A disaccharide synthetase
VGTNKKLFISLADLSAEKYAYYIIKEIITKDENMEILVVAGDKIKELANQINNKYSFTKIKFITNSIKYSSVGFFENFGYIPFAYIEYIKLKEILKKEKPNYVLLIDAPFLNTKLIRYLRSLYDPVIIYLIPPKTWLNKRDKVHKFIEETCDYVILPFRFNLSLYKKSYFFGNPLLDIVNLERSKYIQESKDKLTNKEKNNLGIFPGSRKFELLFISKDALNIIQDRDIYTIFDKFLISSLIQNKEILINSLKKGNIDKINNIKVEIVKDNMEIYQNSLLALSKSGTIVFENILNNLSTITYYKVFKISEITFKLLKKIEVKYISIPNLLIEYEFKDEMISNLPNYLKDDYLVVEELIQDQYNLYNLKSKIFRVYNEIESYNFKIRVFNEILRAYYPKDSLKKISDFILNITNK